MEKLKIAINKLMLEKPFFGSVATKIEFVENNNIVGLNYKGDIVEYNSEYLERLNIEELCTIVATSAMQKALFHESRGTNKVKSVWSTASEYAINSMLLQNGFVMHPLAKFSQEFNGLYAEEIYQILLSDYKEPNEQEEKIEIKDEDFELFLEQIINKLSKLNELPSGIERILPKYKEAKISWRELLYNYIQNHAKIDYSLFPPNKKHLYRGFALPSINSEILKIAVAIDSSASIDDKLLAKFLSELEEIMQSFLHYEILLIECDYKVQNVARLSPLEPILPQFSGGGATDFRPVFEYLEELNEDFKFLIYFSDGEGKFPQNEPNIDTLWVLSKDVNVPFGDKILIE